MFCNKCGASIHEEAVICTKCGCQVTNTAIKQWHINTVVGLYIISIVIPIIGVIAGIIGCFNLKNRPAGAGMIAVSLIAWVFWAHYWGV